MVIKRTTVIALLGLLALALGAWWLQNARQAGPGSPSGQAGQAGPSGSTGQGSPGAGPRTAGSPPAAGGGRGPVGPAAVEVGRVERMRLVEDAVAVGSVRSHQSVTLRPEVSGRIAAIGFREGQRVGRGQLMVQLDDALQRAQLQQAEAQASLARIQLQRNRELVAQGFVSQSAVDQSAGALEVAEAQVAVARAQLARMKVLSPFAGQVGIRKVDVGEFVKDGADLVVIEDTSRMWVDFRLPERYLANMRPGLAVEVQADALGARRFAGRVEALDSQVDADGRALQVRARLDDPEGVLRAGMYARVRTVLAARDDALVVPEEALVPEGGKQYLIKVVDGPDGKVSQRLEARLGLRVPGRAEVLEGLAEGDLVVTAGQARLMRGDALPLRVIELPVAGGAAGATGRSGANGANGVNSAPGANGPAAPSGAASAARPQA